MRLPAFLTTYKMPHNADVLSIGVGAIVNIGCAGLGLSGTMELGLITVSC